jgi:polyisoprenoid-binding protein YceI
VRGRRAALGNMQTKPAFIATTPQPGHYDIDPDRSRVTFATRHLFGLGRVKGSLAIRGGTADVADPVAASAIYAEIETASFRTRSRQRDRSVLSPRFLDPAGHPVMTFRSDRIEAEGQEVAPPGQHGQGPVTKERGLEPSGGSRGVAPPGQHVLTGTLTVRGTTRPVTLTLARCEVSRGSFTARATARIDRTEFGITAARGLAARYLDLTVEVQCTRN